MKRFLSSIFRFAVMRRIKKGIQITIIPSYVCNIKCSYCGRDQLGKHPFAETRSIGEWILFMANLDTSLRKDRCKIKLISLTGGEPTLLPYFTELCNWILNKGWMLDVYSNLTNIKPIKLVKQSTRFIVHATYHHNYVDPEVFVKNWKELDKIHRVEVQELGTERKLKNVLKKTWLRPLTVFPKKGEPVSHMRFDPNLNLYLFCTADMRANI